MSVNTQTQINKITSIPSVQCLLSRTEKSHLFIGDWAISLIISNTCRVTGDAFKEISFHSSENTYTENKAVEICNRRN